MSVLRTIVLILIAAVALSVNGATIGTDAASQAASRFLSSGQLARINASPVTVKLVYKEPSAVHASAVDYYVFNTVDEDAFVIIAGDDRAREVLAYGDGYFDEKRVPDNLRWLLDHYAKQVEYLYAHPKESISVQSSSLESSEVVIPEMLTTRWGQGTPYRNLCPKINGQPCVTGCVATAMAQVMNYWQFPAVLPAQAAYVTSTQHISVPALPSESIEWDLMQNTYSQSNYDEEQANAVATLMRYCGQSCRMDYDIAKSGAWPVDQLKAFKEFGYNPSADLVSRVDFTDEDWTAMLLGDLTQMRPVIYFGHSSSNNHSFIIDGYDGSKYHINWGWNGYLDGYYELDVLTPIGLMPNDPQQMIHGLSPSDDSYNFDFIKNGIAYNFLDENSVAIAPFSDYSGDIVIPDTVRFGGHTFRVTEIADSAFYSSSIESIVLPQSITAIGTSAFSNSGIKQIIIPKSVTTIGNMLFRNCASLESVTINSPLTKIVQSMFYGCTALTDIDIPETVTAISDYAFSRSGLTNITIPSTVTSIGKNAFFKCVRLKTVTINARITNISESMFEDCIALNHVDIPETVVTISTNAFKNSALNDIMIPQSVSSIGRYAFKYCSHLSRLELQGNALTIGNEAFADAPLTDITCLTICPPVASVDCFKSVVYGNATLQVLKQAEDRFRDVEPWKRFSHIETLVDSTFILIGDAYYSQTSDTTLTLCLSQRGNETVEIPEEVLFEGRTFTIDAIGDYAFLNNHDLITLVIPQTIKVLGIAAFSGCDNLKNVTIKSTELSMGSNAFDGTAIGFLTCMSEIPPSGNSSCFTTSVYQNCILSVPSSSKPLYKVTEPWSNFSNVISFGNDLVEAGDFCYYLLDDESAYIFSYSGEDQNVIIPETVIIDDVDYPVRVIGDYVFKGHNEIFSVTLPTAIHHIGVCAFDHCSNLKEIVLPDSLEYIGDFAFSYCNQLTEIVLPNSVRYLGRGAFSGDSRLKQATVGDGITEIPYHAFYNCMALSRVYLGDNVQSIGDQAFFMCYKMDSLYLSQSLSSIGVNAFAVCQQLKHVFISDLAAWCGVRIKDVYGSPLYASSGKLYLNGDELIECKIPDGVAIVNDYVFAGCTSIKCLMLPATVTSIGRGAFEFCESLDTISFSEGLTNLGNACFLNCKKLKRIKIPDSVTCIGIQAFTNCSSLCELRFGKTLSSIESNAFYNCGALTSLEFPDALIELGPESFRNCSNLSSIIFGKGLKTIGGFAFASCTKLTALELPHGVTEIGDGAFRDCYGLTTISLPDSITTIGLATFTNCSELQHIEIPKAVISLGANAFLGCSSLESIVAKAKMPPVCDASFDNVNYQNAVLFVPEQSLQAYKSDPEWKRFKSITGVCMSNVVGDLNCDDEVSIADVNVLINAIVAEEMDSRMDLNGDGELNVGDINEIIDIILQTD